MKGINIFLFLLTSLFLLIIPVNATVVEYEDTAFIPHIDDHTHSSGLNYEIEYIGTPNIVSIKDMHYIDVAVASWTGSSEQSDWADVNLYIDGDYVGHGSLGFFKSSGTYHVRLYVWSFDIGDKTGLKKITWTFKSGETLGTMTGDHGSEVGAGWENGAARFGKDYGSGNRKYLRGYYTVSYTYYFLNTVEYIYNQADGYMSLSVNRSSTYPSMLYIHDGNIIQANETSLQTTDRHIPSTDVTNNSWLVELTNDRSTTISKTLVFIPIISSVGTIELNQSSYTEPEPIQIDVELTTYDFTDHSYYMITEVSEDLDYWDNVAGTYNGTTKITTTTATRILDVDTWLYNLPIWIRSKLVDYDKLTGEYTTLDTTPAVLFNPPIPGSIKFGGTVIDSDTNQIISSALVSVDGVTTTSDTTNAFGEFLIYLYPGIYTVTTSKTGYQTSTSEDLLMEYDNTWAQIYLTPISYGNGTLYGNVNDADTGYAIKDVHVIITNATGQIDAYTSSGGYYEATGLAQSSTYTIQAVKSGYYTYNGSVTTEASGASHKSFNMVPETATPTPTPTVLPTSTYPGGEGHEWTNDEIVTMLRVIVPGFFLLMLVFLLLAVMLGLSGNNGNNGQGRSGLGELWRR